jgi:low affinity Fe/Cu permease
MLSEAFSRFARWMERQSGRPGAFVTAFAVVLLWGLTGPLFHFSDTWQLVINTGTTIVTFLMVFIIQNAQNRDTQAIHLKLDELIRATVEARDELVDLESLSDRELDTLQKEFHELREHFHTRGEAATHELHRRRGGGRRQGDAGGRAD